jgi:serine/threonine protein phosphatase PrpC
MAVAVSDGHGDKRHDLSDIGSALAIEAALSEISLIMFGLIDACDLDSIKNTFEEMIPRRIVRKWRNLIDDYHREYLNDESVSDSILIRYGTTLLVTLYFGNYIMTGQIGDGNILWMKSEDRIEFIGKNNIMNIGSQTDSLCSPDSSLRWTCNQRNVEGGGYLILTTDGLINSFKDDNHVKSFVSGLAKLVQEYGPNQIADKLPEWFDNFSQTGSGDDIGFVFVKLPKIKSYESGLKNKSPISKDIAPKNTLNNEDKKSVSKIDGDPTNVLPQITSRLRTDLNLYIGLVCRFGNQLRLVLKKG